MVHKDQLDPMHPDREVDLGEPISGEYGTPKGWAEFSEGVNEILGGADPMDVLRAGEKKPAVVKPAAD